LPPYRFKNVVLSEWTKLRTVRSTFWTLFVGAILGVGLSALISGVSASHYYSDVVIRATWDPVGRSIRPLLLAQLAFAVLGVLTVTAEYSTGMIRTSLAAVPRRSMMMTAKMAVSGVVTLVVGEIVAFAAFLVGQVLIHSVQPTVPYATLGQHNVLRVVIGAGLYLAVVSLLASGFAVLLRHAAAGIAVVVAMLFIVPGLAAALPSSWSQPIEEYWPTNAGTEVYSLTHGPHALSAWTGLGEMALFTVLVVAVAFYVLERRDA
jgi:ABC-type transport system involved in multi-copper enzyme maturation permease subunit